MAGLKQLFHWNFWKYSHRCTAWQCMESIDPWIDYIQHSLTLSSITTMNHAKAKHIVKSWIGLKCLFLWIHILSSCQVIFFTKQHLILVHLTQQKESLTFELLSYSSRLSCVLWHLLSCPPATMCPSYRYYYTSN
mgnify:FL=1